MIHPITLFPTSCRFNPTCTVVKKLLFVLLTSNYVIECTLVINKCCGAGMIFGDGLNCVQKPGANSDGEFYWFPNNSIVDGKTLKIYKSRREVYTKLLENATVNFGKKPECDDREIDSTTFTEEKPLFNFLHFGDEMKVHVSSNKTLHHFSQGSLFPVVEMGEEETNDTKSSNVKANEAPLRTFPLSTVCVDAIINTNRHRILICPCNSSICIRKCCKNSEYYNMTAQTCTPMDDIPGTIKKWRPLNFGWQSKQNNLGSRTRFKLTQLVVCHRLSKLNEQNPAADLLPVTVNEQEGAVFRCKGLRKTTRASVHTPIAITSISDDLKYGIKRTIEKENEMELNYESHNTLGYVLLVLVFIYYWYISN